MNVTLIEINDAPPPDVPPPDVDVYTIANRLPFNLTIAREACAQLSLTVPAGDLREFHHFLGYVSRTGDDRKNFVERYVLLSKT